MNDLLPALRPLDQAAAAPDVAYTSPEVVRALLRQPELLPAPTAPVWEPCAGSGVWIEQLRAAGHVAEGTEIDARASSVQRGLARHGDAMRPCPYWGEGAFEVWTNPPFSIANDLCRAWILGPRPPRRIVLLMLQQWLVPDERMWLWQFLRSQIVLYPRLSFSGPGRTLGDTDMREYAIHDLWISPRPSASATFRRLDWRLGRVS